MKIGIVGATGRMGQMLVKEVLSHANQCELSGVTARAVSKYVGQDIGEVCGMGTIGTQITDKGLEVIKSSDAIIDFTSPEASIEHAKICAQRGVIHIIGTTGLNKDQEHELQKIASQTPIIYAPNMSVGVNLLLSLVEQAAQKLSDEYDIEIFEAHHKHKVDAPSGTALALGQAAANGRNIKLPNVAITAREGITGERETGQIGFSVMRGGDIAGEHTVYFATEGERLELSHRASNRNIFAKGAIKAALWAKDQPPGLYTMKDVLGL